MVVARMAMMMAPGTRLASSATMTMKPHTARMTDGAVSAPSVTSVAGWATTMPAFFSAMMPRNRPMPAEIAIFRLRGMALMTHSRTGRMVRMMNSTPDRNTAPSATCHVCPMPSTTP